MNEAKRRFFSGDSLQQALVQAANQFQLQPEEIAYQVIEKRHGFVKTRRKVVIAVDPAAPQRVPGEVPAAVPAPVPLPAPPPAAEVQQARPVQQERPPRPEESGHRGRSRRGRRGAHGGERSPETRPDRQLHAGAGVPAQSGPRDHDEEEGFGNVLPPGERGLLSLPDRSRPIGDRYPAAEGPQAEAAAHGIELLLRIAGLELKAQVYQGEERLEIDLKGADADWCFADDGELLMSIEHLLPRVIRTLSGHAVLCRVDCDNFHEIREERLRSLAQRVADEVRLRGKPRTLVPMNPADRRIVHVTLADNPAVVTESLGEGYFKRITVRLAPPVPRGT